MIRLIMICFDIMNLFAYALFFYIILQYIMPTSPITRYLSNICEPILSIVRKYLYRIIPQLYRFPLDISPIIIIILMNIIRRILFWLLFLFR